MKQIFLILIILHVILGCSPSQTLSRITLGGTTAIYFDHEILKYKASENVRIGVYHHNSCLEKNDYELWTEFHKATNLLIEAFIQFVIFDISKVEKYLTIEIYFNKNSGIIAHTVLLLDNVSHVHIEDNELKELLVGINSINFYRQTSLDISSCNRIENSELVLWRIPLIKDGKIFSIPNMLR